VSADQQNLEFVPLNFSQNILPQLLDVLYAREIQSVIVEGGRQLLQSFIDQDLWDEAHVYIGNTWFGRGVQAPKLPSENEMLHDTRLQVFYRQG